jgi:DNA-binding transcriptional MerR regulator
VATSTTGTLTIDELAAVTGTTSRRVRSFQTLGLLPHPQLQGRTGVYGAEHVDRVTAILRLQDRGFSLESLVVLFRALAEGRSLGDVLGLAAPAGSPVAAVSVEDDGERYGFDELETSRPGRGRSGRPWLALVPSTMWDESAAS